MGHVFLSTSQGPKERQFWNQSERGKETKKMCHLPHLKQTNENTKNSL